MKASIVRLEQSEQGTLGTLLFDTKNINEFPLTIVDCYTKEIICKT